ncbi:hypothetical protein D3C80_1779910 [compost metagenome]
MMAAHCSKQVVSTHVEITAEFGKGLICRGNLLKALGEGVGPGIRRLDLSLPGVLDRVFTVRQQLQRFGTALPRSL